MKKLKTLGFAIVMVIIAFSGVMFGACGSSSLEKIRIDHSSVSLTVEWGTTFNYDDIVVIGVYKDKAEKEIDSKDWKVVQSIDTRIVGTQTLIIECQKLQDSVEVQVTEPTEKVVASIEIDKTSIEESTVVGAEYDTTGLIIKVTYENGYKESLSTGFDITKEVSTAEAGEQTLQVSYQGKTAEVKVMVKNSYQVRGYTDPQFVVDYNTNKTLKNEFTKTGSTGTKGFEIINVDYKVGNDNAFIYSPILSVKTAEGDYEDLTTYKAIIEVSIWENGEYKLLTDNVSEYVTFNDTKHTFNFTDKAIGNKFQIKMLPFGMTDEEKEIVSAKTFDFEVVDGWNAYTAKDISLIDNMNEQGKWTDYKTSNDIDINLNVNSIILHDNITLKDSDLPASQFLGEDEVQEGDDDYDLAFGSLKDEHSSDYGFIYHRKIADGETFTIEGNYFRLSAENISKIVRQEIDDVRKINTTGNAITTHTSLLGFSGDTSSSVMGQGYIKNLHLIGNTQKSDDALMSGGVMAMKIRNTSFTCENILSQRWFMSFMVEGSNEYSNNCKHLFNKVNAFDSYNTLLYVWGARDVQIKDSHFIGAGGPVMICDHVQNNQTTGEGGYITNVKTTNSVLESFVAGSEGWFATYEGSGALVGSIKAMNALVTPYGNTLCDKNGQKINLIAVYKSGSAEGLTSSKIRGSFSDGKYTSGLDLSDAGVEYTKQQVIKQLMEQEGMSQAKLASLLEKMAILQTFNGAIGVPGTDGWLSAPDTTTFAQADDYMNVYLFNGMAAVLGMTKNA